MPDASSACSPARAFSAAAASRRRRRRRSSGGWGTTTGKGTASARASNRPSYDEWVRAAYRARQRARAECTPRQQQQQHQQPVWSSPSRHHHDKQQQQQQQQQPTTHRSTDAAATAVRSTGTTNSYTIIDVDTVKSPEQIRRENMTAHTFRTSRDLDDTLICDLQELLASSMPNTTTKRRTSTSQSVVQHVEHVDIDKAVVRRVPVVKRNHSHNHGTQQEEITATSTNAANITSRLEQEHEFEAAPANTATDVDKYHCSLLEDDSDHNDPHSMDNMHLDNMNMEEDANIACFDNDELDDYQYDQAQHYRHDSNSNHNIAPLTLQQQTTPAVAAAVAAAVVTDASTNTTSTTATKNNNVDGSKCASSSSWSMPKLVGSFSLWSAAAASKSTPSKQTRTGGGDGNAEADMNTDPVKRAIVFAPLPPLDNVNVNDETVVAALALAAVAGHDDDDDDDDDENKESLFLDREPFLVSMLFGQQTVGVHNTTNDDKNDANAKNNSDNDNEFGDMVRSWFVAAACWLVCLWVLSAVEMGEGRGRQSLPAVLNAWTMPTTMTTLAKITTTTTLGASTIAMANDSVPPAWVLQRQRRLASRHPTTPASSILLGEEAAATTTSSPSLLLHHHDEEEKGIYN
jgi:hypothetical protein